MIKNKKILILTGGGESQTINATLYGIIKKAREEGMQILGGVRGWASLLDGGRIVDLTDIDLDGIENYGGTILKTSRTNPFKIENGIEHIKKIIHENRIDYIIAIGGDDTLGAAKKLFEEEKINIVGIPKTADNDLSSTYFSPGFPSAAHNLIKLTNEIRRDSAMPRHRLFLIESQGGNAGWLPMSSAIGKADLITIPEFNVNLSEFLLKVEEIYKKNGNYGVICISKETKFDEDLGDDERQDDSFGVKRKQHIVIDLKKVIEERLNIPCQTIIPANSLRNGRGSRKDIELSKKLGKKAVELLKENKIGYISTINYENGQLGILETSLDNVVGKGNYRTVSEEFYDRTNFYPTKAFFDYMHTLLDEIEDDSKYYELMDKLHKE